MKKQKETVPFPEIHCPVCGKLFVCRSDHVYKIREHYKWRKVCTWGCQRAWEKAGSLKALRREKEMKKL